MARRPTPDVSDLAWLIGVLWGPSAEVVRASSRRGRGTAYVVVPGRRRPRALLPDDRGVARAALRGGAGTRSLAAGRRRKVLAGVLGTGAAWQMVRDRVWVPDVDPLVERLGEVLGTPVLLAAALRVRAPFRKPMLQVLAPSGEVIAYAKVAWNDVTALNLRAEREALGAFADERTLRTPEVVEMFEHRGFPVLVTRPMPPGVRRFGANDDPPPLDVTRRISTVLSSLRAQTSIAERLRERLAAAADPQPSAPSWIAPVVAAASRIRDGLDVGALPAGAWHGDWAPWNLGRAGDVVWVWDWEHWRPDVPLGLDVPHYVFQQRFVAQRLAVADAFAAARTASAGAMAALGYDDGTSRSVHAIHVLEVTLRYLEAQRHGVAANPRFVEGALEALDAVQA